MLPFWFTNEHIPSGVIINNNNNNWPVQKNTIYIIPTKNDGLSYNTYLYMDLVEYNTKFNYCPPLPKTVLPHVHVTEVCVYIEIYNDYIL